MELPKRQPEITGTITSLDLREDGINFALKCVMPNYVAGRASFNIEGSLESAGGFIYGTGCGSMEDGTFLGLLAV